jgi:hypothetical protein
MSLELVNTLSTLGTFLVIAATAIAAIVQLRHARSSNHIAALNELRETTESPDFQAAQHFVFTGLRTKVQDPDFRYQFEHRSARSDQNKPFFGSVLMLGNFYESMGLLVKTGLVDKTLVLEMWMEAIVRTWDDLAPMTAIYRRRVGDSAWENFEYLTVLAQDWTAAHPNGSYPSDVRRVKLADEFLEADKQFAASVATA